jgi:hypothetical protein
MAMYKAMYFKNYFSLTQDQNVGTFLTINGNVFIEKALITEKTTVTGLIKFVE